MLTIEDVILGLRILKPDAERNGLTDTVDRYEHIIAWLRELQERRKADSCEGCMHKYGEKLTCQICARYYRDKYVAERRTDADD